MDTERKCSAARANGSSQARRSSHASNALSDAAAFVDWPALQQTLQDLPDSRPEAVARARRLIADADFPSEDSEEMLAELLAVQLTSGMDPLPN